LRYSQRRGQGFGGSGGGGCCKETVPLGQQALAQGAAGGAGRIEGRFGHGKSRRKGCG